MFGIQSLVILLDYCFHTGTKMDKKHLILKRHPASPIFF